MPIWVTISGGDQFVRSELDEIVRLIRVEIEPTIINIPMNGVITERIFTPPAEDRRQQRGLAARVSI